MYKKAISASLILTLLATLFCTSFWSASAATKREPIVFFASETLNSDSAKSLFEAEEITIKLTITPTGKGKGVIDTGYAKYELDVEGLLEPLPGNTSLMIGALFGTVETAQGTKDTALHCELGDGIAVLTMTIDGMGLDYIVFGDLSRPGRKAVLDHYKKKTDMKMAESQSGLGIAAQDAVQESFSIASTPLIQHREHKGTTLFRQLNGSSVGIRTGILNTYSTPPNYDSVNYANQGVLQFRVWSRSEEVRNYLGAPWVGINRILINMKLRNSSGSYADGSFVNWNPPHNATNIAPLLASLWGGLNTANPWLIAASFVIGMVTQLDVGLVNLTPQNWDNRYSGYDLLKWRMGGGWAHNYPATISASDWVLEQSWQYGKIPGEEGGVTVHGLWKIEDAFFPISYQWNHEAQAQIAYDVMVWDHNKGDWALVVYWTEWATVSVSDAKKN